MLLRASLFLCLIGGLSAAPPPSPNFQLPQGALGDPAHQQSAQAAGRDTEQKEELSGLSRAGRVCCARVPQKVLQDALKSALSGSAARMPVFPGKPQVLTLSPPGACSIPLLRAPIPKGKRYTMRTLPAQNSPDAAMSIPAGPVCETK